MLATKVEGTFDVRGTVDRKQKRRQKRPSWRQRRPRQAVEFETGDKSATTSTVADTFDSVADVAPVSATVAFVANVYRALVTMKSRAAR